MIFDQKIVEYRKIETRRKYS